VRVSTRGDYASRALLSLALDGGDTPVSVRDIATRTGLPQPYLEQILLALKGAGLVRSKRGVGGGYVLARSPDDITLGDIVSAVDGPITLGDFGAPTPAGPATTRASACCWRCGPTSPSTCAATSTACTSPTWS
jgi:Rrf2 family protein